MPPLSLLLFVSLQIPADCNFYVTGTVPELPATRDAASTAVTVSVDSAAPVLTLPSNYVGFTLDWWPPEQEGFGSSTVNLINLSHPRLVGYARALGPATLRIGGSLDNVVKYLVGNMTRAECEAPVTFRGEVFPNLCLNVSRFSEVLDFVGSGRGLAPNSTLVFGLQLNLETDGWNSSNVLAFLASASALPSAALEAFEVGEETTPDPYSKAWSAFVSAYSGIREAVDSLWPASTRPLVLGPCTGMNENVAPFTWTQSFVSNITVDAYVMHSYNNDGGDGWTAPGFLAQTAAQAAGLRGVLNADAAARGAPALPLWCGECGPHNGGGLANVTDRAISSFWYTDALNGLPLLGVSRFNRQTLAGASYSLLSNDVFAPRADYFAALAFASLNGKRVLNATTDVNVESSLHVYAACAAEGRGAVTVAFVNVNATRAFALTLSGARGEKTVYAFAPLGGDPLAETLTLNGEALVADGDAPPPLVGSDGDAAAPTAILPWTFGYVVFHDVGARACM
jgi:hypothetical protein